MKFLTLTTTCTACEQKQKHYVKDWEGAYLKDITKVFWCEHCKSMQAVEYSTRGGKATLSKVLDPNSLNLPKAPDTGITIRPRASKGKR